MKKQASVQFDLDYARNVIRAEAAGLRGTGRTAEGSLVAGDIIQAVDGRGIRTVDDLYAVLEEHKAGEVVTLSILRAGKTVTVDVTLGAES